MEIKDPLHGSMEVSSVESHILDSSACQRLRMIKQLGFAEYAFPGALHNRYLHSLGVMHLAGLAFDSIMRSLEKVARVSSTFAAIGNIKSGRGPQVCELSTNAVRQRFRQCVRLAALLHDIGHGPLSHTTEEAMPLRSSLKLRVDLNSPGNSERASHEDYTLKFLLDSDLTDIIKNNFSDIRPKHVAALIDPRIQTHDDFFVDQGFNFRPLLSQIVSSELDVDRMDYLERDAYYCGTNYGRVELGWLLSNLTAHAENGQVHLAINRRAIYTFDDFLISRHHMYLMVYFHHKSIVFEEMLLRYLMSPHCEYKLPSDIIEYTRCTDYSLYEHLAQVDDPWARRISERRPFQILSEWHSIDSSDQRPRTFSEKLQREGIEVIWASSQARLSKYHSGSNLSSNQEPTSPIIYVVDPNDPTASAVPIEKVTQIFQKYQETRHIERLYVDSKDYDLSLKLLHSI